MSKIISFAYTTAALVAGEKTVTRRDWTADYAGRFRGGDICQAWSKQPRFGGERVAMIQLTRNAYIESTAEIPEKDWEAEGFDYLTRIGARMPASAGAGKRTMTLREFWKEWHDQPRRVWVVRFKLLEVMADAAAQFETPAPLTSAAKALPLDHRAAVEEKLTQPPWWVN